MKFEYYRPYLRSSDDIIERLKESQKEGNFEVVPTRGAIRIKGTYDITLIYNNPNDKDIIDIQIKGTPQYIVLNGDIFNLISNAMLDETLITKQVLIDHVLEPYETVFKKVLLLYNSNISDDIKLTLDELVELDIWNPSRMDNYHNILNVNEDDTISTKIKNVIKPIVQNNNKHKDFGSYIDYKLSSEKSDFYKWLFK